MAYKKIGERIRGPYERRPGKWRVATFREDGSREHKEFASEKEALKFRELCEAQLAKISGVTIGEAIELYENHLKAKGNKPQPIVDTIWRLGRMFPQRDVLLASLRKIEDGKQLYQDLCDYRIPRKHKPKEEWKGYAPDSQRNMLAEAKTFLRWAVVQDLTKVNVLEDVKGLGKRSTGADKPQLRIDEARRWTDKAVELAKEGEAGAVAALMTELLALRSSEVTMRKVRDLDDGGRLLWIPDSKTKAGRRNLEIPPILRPMLRRLTRGKMPNDFLLNEGSRPRTRDYPSRWTKRICKLAGVPEVSAHAMRRLHATLSVDSGATGHIVAASLGHESFSTTLDSYAKRGSQDVVSRRKALKVLTGGRGGDEKDPQTEVG